MVKHFRSVAKEIKRDFGDVKILEIGSNDGTFIKNFDLDKTVAVEPCGNFAKLTTKMGYTTHNEFWSQKLAVQLAHRHNRFDVIYSANCMCHIQDLDSAFRAIYYALDDNGVFIFEDPSLLEMLERNSYDQIYDEHAHIFSVTALNNILHTMGFEIFRVDKTLIHGGSNRIFVRKKHSINNPPDGSLDIELEQEDLAGISNKQTYLDFADRVEVSKHKLLELLHDIKDGGNKIVSYGATSKSTSVFNYCGIGPDLIDYITDTTPDKQGKLSPGVHIPVVSPKEGFDDSVDYAFLGAWNFLEEITKKESKFLRRGGQFITHVPEVRTLRGEPICQP
tara:strand:- start:745 stop:1749 length:1005 start_codon:yes stop_codon:yes gene_type:complete